MTRFAIKLSHIKVRERRTQFDIYVYFKDADHAVLEFRLV